MSNADRGEDIIDVYALLSAVERRFHRLGGDQVMSVGPTLTVLDDLEEEVHQRAIGYGVIAKSTSIPELKHQAATRRRVTVEPADGTEQVQHLGDGLDDARAILEAEADELEAILEEDVGLEAEREFRDVIEQLRHRAEGAQETLEAHYFETVEEAGRDE